MLLVPCLGVPSVLAGVSQSLLGCFKDPHLIASKVPALTFCEH
jgi:hypothetical protein